MTVDDQVAHINVFHAGDAQDGLAANHTRQLSAPELFEGDARAKPGGEGADHVSCVGIDKAAGSEVACSAQRARAGRDGRPNEKDRVDQVHVFFGRLGQLREGSEDGDAA